MLTSVDVGAQRVADDAGGPLHLGVGVLVVGRADDEAQPMRKANYASLVTLALWSTKSASGKPAQGTEDSEPARPPCSALARWRERTHSAMSSSWPTQEAPHQRPRCPKRPVCGSRGGRNAPGTYCDISRFFPRIDRIFPGEAFWCSR